MRCAFAVVGVLLVFLAGCSRNQNEKKQKYLESGQRYLDRGQYREAEIQFQNAIQVDSRFAEAHYKLSQLYAVTGDFATVGSHTNERVPTSACSVRTPQSAARPGAESRQIESV